MQNVAGEKHRNTDGGYIVPFDDLLQVERVFHSKGYVELDGVLGSAEIARLESAFEEGVSAGTIRVGIEELASSTEGNDAVFKHPYFLELAKHPGILSAVSTLIGKNIELQHSKLNCKPLQDKGKGLIQWHQDYPFFPHTNLDLVAVSIHFDDEDIDSGSIRFVPGSHREGIKSHCRDGKFAHELADSDSYCPASSDLMVGKAGRVMIHHCLTTHKSDPKTNSKTRRILILQYRATDCIQLAGVLWRCTGMHIQGEQGAKFARFMDGSRVELRGEGGRLFDLFGGLAPNK